MENSKDSDRRRNVFDIVADLGFLDRKPLPVRADPAPPAEPRSTAPPALTLLKPLLLPPPHPLDTLTEAQQRAAEQRMAAERLLQEAIELEQRLAEEAAQARAANDEALERELAAALDDMRAAEREAAERADLCSKTMEPIAAQRAQAEALLADDRNALAEARRRLEVAEAACSESTVRLNDASAAEDTARAAATAAADVVAAHRAAREEMEGRLRGIQERALPDAATRIAERRAADAAKRIAERQAADAQRGAAS